jgi:hypothetical protein
MLEWTCEHIQTVSVVVGLAAFLALIVVRSRREDSLKDLLWPGLVVGFAAGHLPAALLLVIAAIDTSYLKCLENQRIQMALAGAAIGLFVADKIIARFRRGGGDLDC